MIIITTTVIYVPWTTMYSLTTRTWALRYRCCECSASWEACYIDITNCYINKTATSHLCSTRFYLCESWILQKRFGLSGSRWLDHCAKEEPFSELNCVHCSYMAHWWVLFNAQAAWAVSRKRSLEAVGSLWVVCMELQKGGRVRGL